jgi:cation diffusion facilitator CzcD-associated flavoprotein CzcO
MEPVSSRHVVIIGAGPAGLAAAFCLAQRKIGYTLLERGASAVAALRQADPDMALLSPTRLSRLPAMPWSAQEPAYLPFRDFVQKLEKYCEQHKIQIRANAEAISVSRNNPQGFVVRYRDHSGATQTLNSSHVINATGIISVPQFPENFNPAACTFRWKHSLDVRSADLMNVRRLVVVGGGSSAAEVLERWLEVRPAEARAQLLLRSPLRAIVNPILGLVDVHYLVWLIEQTPTHLLGWRAGRLPEPMNGRLVLAAIKQGLISRLRTEARFEKDAIIISEGQCLKPDFVVFATGFRYATAHLADLIEYDPDGRPRVCCCESTRTSGLYLLGFRFGRTFASPYVRGIARDARYVARKIAQAR